MSLSFNGLFSNFAKSLRGWYWTAFKVDAVGFAIPFIVLVSALMVVFSSELSRLEQIAAENAGVIAASSFSGSFLVAYFSIIIVTSVLGFIVTAGMLGSVTREDRAKLSVSDVFSIGVSHLLRFIGFSLLPMLLFIPLFFFAILLELNLINGLIFLFFMLAFMAFLFIFCVYWCVSIVVFFRESGPINALRKSFALVKGNWWRTFGALLLMYVGLIAIGAVLSPVFFVMFIISVGFPIAGGILSVIVSGLLSMAVSPLVVGYFNALHDALAAQ